MKHLLIAIFTLTSLFSSGQVKRELALQALDEGRYAEALDDLTDLYDDQPTDFYYERIVDCYLGLKQYDRGVRFIESHIDKVNVRQGMYRIDLGYLHLMKPDTVSAEDAFNRVIDEVRHSPGLAYQYSERFKKWGVFKFALATYEVAEQSDPKLAFDTQKALVYAELGMLVEMYTAYLDALERNPNFLTNMQQIIRFSMDRDGSIPMSAELKREIIVRIRDNGNVAFNRLLIWVLTSEGEFNQAFSQLRALYLRGEIQPFEILQLAQQATAAEDFRTASRIYSYLIEEGDKTPYRAESIAGKLKAEKKKLESENAPGEEFVALMADFNRAFTALKASSVRPELMLIAAEVQFTRLHQPDSALALIGQCLDHTRNSDPIAARARLLRGDIELATGQPYDAILTYAQVETELATAPLGQEARFRKARVAFYTGEFEWALSSFDVLKTSTSKLIANDAMRLSLLIKDNAALDTTYTMLEVYAGVLLLKAQNRLEESLRTLDTLDQRLVLSVDHPLLDESLYTRAEILSVQGHYQLAADRYLEVADKYPKDLLADVSLIKAARLYLRQLNDPDRARQLFEKVLLEHTNSIYAEEAREEFRRLRGDPNT